ncbi:basic proline-rich protein-like [Chroicocephalus ridibundus]|uniref:basic proline-rich protein-like n=1 Tax=Chroicocephalus ridibundus TaxID=1192867 RepID=UPI002FDEA9A4
MHQGWASRHGPFPPPPPPSPGPQPRQRGGTARRHPSAGGRGSPPFNRPAAPGPSVSAARRRRARRRPRTPSPRRGGSTRAAGQEMGTVPSCQTPRGGGEHRPPPSSPPLPPPSPSSLRGALVPPACRARRAAAPATALRSFFFFLLSVAHDLLAPSGETPPAPALPAAEGHRGQALPYARRCGRIHNSRGNTDRPPPPIPCRSLPPPPAAAASRRPAQRQPASPPASAPRPRRRDSADRSSHDRSQAGAAPRRRDFAERKQVPGHPAALGRPGRVCAERSPGRLTRWRDSSARSCPLNARDSPPWGRVELENSQASVFSAQSSEVLWRTQCFALPVCASCHMITLIAAQAVLKYKFYFHNFARRFQIIYVHFKATVAVGGRGKDLPCNISPLNSYSPGIPKSSVLFIMHQVALCIFGNGYSHLRIVDVARLEDAGFSPNSNKSFPQLR